MSRIYYAHLLMTLQRFDEALVHGQLAVELDPMNPLIGAFLAGAFLVISVHAFYLLKDRYTELSQKALKIALMVATVSALAQLVTGHHSADGVAENQPAKLAAFEGHFEEKLRVISTFLDGWIKKPRR